MLHSLRNLFFCPFIFLSAPPYPRPFASSAVHLPPPTICNFHFSILNLQFSFPPVASSPVFQGLDPSQQPILFLGVKGEG